MLHSLDSYCNSLSTSLPFYNPLSHPWHPNCNTLHISISCNHWPGKHVERLVDHALQVAQMLQGGITLAVCSLVVWVEKVLVVGHSVVAVLVESAEQFLQTLLDFVCLNGKERKRSTFTGSSEKKREKKKRFLGSFCIWKERVVGGNFYSWYTIKKKNSRVWSLKFKILTGFFSR